MTLAVKDHPVKGHPVKNHTVKDMILHSCLEYADRIAFVSDLGGTKITYEKLEEDIGKLVRYLYDHGLRGEKAALIGKNSGAYALLLLAAMCSEMTVIPIDPMLGTEDIAERIRLSDASIVFADNGVLRQELQDICPQCRFSLLNTAVRDALSDTGYGYDLKRETLGRDHVGLMLFSSGTGGRMKLAQITQHNLTAEWDVVKHYDQVMDRALIVSPLYHILGLTDLTGNLFLGKSIYISEGFSCVLKELKYVRPKCMRMVPATADWIARMIGEKSPEKGRDLLGGNLRNIRTSGAPLDDRIRYELRRFGIHTVSDYGMTEVTGPVAVAVAEGEDLMIPDGTVGRVIDGLEISFDKKNGSEYGEIILRGKGVFKGYYKDEEATRESLRDGVLHTGDIGWLDQEGYLHITGRSKNVIILPSGENIIPEIMEKELLKCALIRECVICRQGDTLAARIVPSDKKEQTGKGIKEYIREFNRNNPVFRQIGHVHIVDQLERTGTGKVKR